MDCESILLIFLLDYINKLGMKTIMVQYNFVRLFPYFSILLHNYYKYKIRSGVNIFGIIINTFLYILDIDPLIKTEQITSIKYTYNLER